MQPTARLMTSVAIGARGVWYAQDGHLFCWAPVAMGVGIAVYFTRPVEPAFWLAALALAFGVCVIAGARALPDRARALLLTAALAATGFGLAGVRAHMVAEPVLGFRYYGPIEGRLVEIDRSQSGALRFTLDQVVLARMAPDRTPSRVRVSLHGDQGFFEPEPGQRLIMTGHLSPPNGPVEPGGFDFQRMAWFQGLGAVGYTRTPVLLAGPAGEGAAGLSIYRQRTAITQGLVERMPAPSGGLAAAIIVGDRSQIDETSLEVLRATNLAHLLAISGMHMGILAAFIFGTVRSGLALWPRIALRHNTKKIAAVVALLVATAYLAMSGGNVSTQRAYVQVTVMLVAVLCDRRALTLRSVAIAAMIVLALRPEALFGPGFQMSFAATTALVGSFALLRDVQVPRLPKWLQAVGGVFMSSLIAGLATAPIAAFHFNQVSQYGLVANLLAVPLMGTVVMPSAVLATVLAPLGLEMVGLWIMHLGLSWIMAVAHFIADLGGSLRHVPTPPGGVLVAICLGALLVVLWQGRAKWLGVVPALIGFGLWQVVDRPALLVASSGSLIGVMTEEGRALSKERGEGFAADSWLENDGAPVPQGVAYARPGLVEDGRRVDALLGPVQVANLRGATALDALEGCGGADIIITNQESAARRGCEVFDIRRLRDTGALAIWVEADKVTIVTAREVTGARLWNTRAMRDRPDPLLDWLFD